MSDFTHHKNEQSKELYIDRYKKKKFGQNLELIQNSLPAAKVSVLPVEPSCPHRGAFGGPPAGIRKVGPGR
jgi:hypothetical protein